MTPSGPTPSPRVDLDAEPESSDAAEVAGLDLRPRTSAADAMGTKTRGSWLAVLVLLVVVAGAFLVVRNLGSATMFFYNADEAVAMKGQLGVSRFKLQGTVACSSVAPVSDGVTFDVTFHGATVPVHHQGDPPQLFQPGIPVLLEGAWAADGARFDSDRIYVKHTEEYTEVEGDRLAEAEAEAAEVRTVGEGITGEDLCGGA